jgi:tRNA pseudouridine55 synthase
MNWALDGQKRYVFTVCWGEERATDDLEGDVTAVSGLRPVPVQIESILSCFTGDITQTPPAFSAIKIDGERAYDLARAGEEVPLQPRAVHVAALRFFGAPDPDHARFELVCGKGTYVRALARDMGRALGCLGHVVALRRTGVGPFSEADMIPLEKLVEMGHKPGGDEAISGALRPIETVLDGIPALAVDGTQAQRLRQGQPVLLRGANAPIASDAVLVTSGGKPLGLCCIEQGSLKPKRLFNL